ncbi:MAG: hypothetical protein HUU01_04385 [Saprospiraceae bacterium]|nr:hypothetical protein [Saprospiraceae bacterium]
MSEFLSFMLEIIKLTVPGLLVFFTTYYLLRQYLNGQLRLKQVENKQNHQQTTIPLRLQAYERLSLFCERIALPNLLLRVRKEGMTVAELKLSLILAIQMEYEHNITQQVYVSQQLWQIIKIARDNTVGFVSAVAENLDHKGDGRELAELILRHLANQDTTGLDTALLAIGKEAGALLG